MPMERYTNDSPFEYASQETLYVSEIGGEELEHNLYNTKLVIFQDHSDLNHIEYQDFFNQKMWLIFQADESIGEMLDMGFDNECVNYTPKYDYVSTAYLKQQNDRLELYLKEIQDGNNSKSD